MKLMKLNAIVLFYSLVMSICTESETMNQVERRKKFSIYDENDKFLNKVKTPRQAKPDQNLFNSGHSFLEKTSQKTNELVIIHGKNPLLTINPEYIGSKKCEYKQGFLEIIDREAEKKVETKKVRVLLTKDSIKLYTTMNENSLFATVHLDNIMKVTQDKKFYHTYCFDLVTNIAESTDLVLHMSKLTLCAENSLDMDDWNYFILELKECKLNQNNSSKVVIDFNQINKIKKKNSQSIEDSGIWYDNSNRSKQKYTTVSVRDNLIHQTMKNLMQNLKTNQYDEIKLKRNLNDKLVEARKFTNELEKKSQIVKEIIEKKIEDQMNNNLKLVKTKAQSKEVKLIKAMVQKIQNIKVKFLLFRNKN